MTQQSERAGAPHAGPFRDTTIKRPQCSEVEQIQSAARRWYDREIERRRAALGETWPEHAAWVEDYLREELRRRLATRGWRDA